MKVEEAILELKIYHADMVKFNLSDHATVMAIQALERTRWIPVSERLPEKDDYVLAVFETCLPFVSMYFSGVKKFSCEGEEANPTHWMSLPNPPQEVE